MNHATQKRVVGGGLDSAVHEPGLGEFHLVLQAQSTTAVHQPERTAGGRHRGHRSVEELDVKLRWLNVRFGQVGDLGHQLANLVLCLLEQTSINGFFRHRGTSGLEAESASSRQGGPVTHFAAPEREMQSPGSSSTPHADADNGTTKFPTFLTGLLETAASRPLSSSFPVFPQMSIPAESLQIVNVEVPGRFIGRIDFDRPDSDLSREVFSPS